MAVTSAPFPPPTMLVALMQPLRAALVRTAAPARAAASVPTASMHTTSRLGAAPRPAVPKTKLKTHTGAKKRFIPTQSGTQAIAVKFKRTMPNKQHLNSRMSRVRLNRLVGTTVVSSGPVARMLRRMLGPRL